MINLYTASEVEKIRTSCRIVHDVLEMIGVEIRPGVTTLEIDRKIQQYIKSKGAVPAFLGYRGFPSSACVSVNEQWFMEYLENEKSRQVIWCPLM